MASRSYHYRTGQTVQERGREVNLRRAFASHGYIVERAASREPTLLRHGGYRVRSQQSGHVVFGELWELTLDDLRAFLDVIRLVVFLHKKHVVSRGAVKRMAEGAKP